MKSRDLSQTLSLNRFLSRTVLGRGLQALINRCVILHFRSPQAPPVWAALVAAVVFCILAGNAQAGPTITLRYKGEIDGQPTTVDIRFEDIRTRVNAGFSDVGGRLAWARQDALTGWMDVAANVIMNNTVTYMFYGEIQSNWGYMNVTATQGFQRFRIVVDFPYDGNFVYIDRFRLIMNPRLIPSDPPEKIYDFDLDVPAPTATPVLAAIPNQTVNEGATLTFVASATDADVPAQTLTFTLDAGAPAGATIHPSSGVFSWTPTDAQGPGTYSITMRVSDSGSPALSDTKTFTVIVNEVNVAPANVAPVLAAIPNQTVNEGETLTVAASATDADTLAQALTFSLDAGAPAGATIDPRTGVFSWMPTEAQGPGTYSITVRVSDTSSPVLSDEKTFSVIVNEVNVAPANVAPVLAAIPNQTVNEGATLSFTASATDADVPAQTLTFSLDEGAPAGATIHLRTGVFSWIPTGAQATSTHNIAVRVTDNGSPNLSDTKTVTIVVTGSVSVVSELKLTGIIRSTGGAATIQWSATPGSTYRLLYKNSLDAPVWNLVGEMVATSNSAVLEDKNAATVSQRFYRVEETTGTGGLFQ